MLIALTRPVSPSIGDCALSFIEREPIHVDLAQRQHEAYEACLRTLGVTLVEIPEAPDLPDAVFVEDTAVVVEEVAVLTAPSLESRRQEVESVAEVLGGYRPLERLTGEAHLDGGDVLRIGRSIYVGISSRTNEAAASQLAGLLAPHGYTVRTVRFAGCLHLKSACTFIGHDAILVNPAWVDPTQIKGVEVVAVAPEEPHAANALPIGETVLLPSAFPATRRLLEGRGFHVQPVDVSELQKAEAGVTCCSIVFQSMD